jgi:hypothetical protein
VFSGFFSRRRRDSAPLFAATRSSTLRTMSWAFSSVGAMIGRNATWIFGTSPRPAARAAAFTDSICSAVLASGSPHRQ